MRFWHVSVFNTELNQQEHFRVAGPDVYSTAQVRKTLQEVHPEYQDIKFKRIKKPEGWNMFENRSKRYLT